MGLWDNSVLSYKGTLILSYRGLSHFISPPAMSEHEWSIFSSFLAFGVNNNFNVSHLNRDIGVSQFDFNLHFLNG